jgi:YVTN family beta-propeller protein
VVGAVVPVEFAPFDVAITPTAVWVTNAASDTVSKIDPVSNSVLISIALSTDGHGVPFAIAVGDDGSLWVSDAAFDDAGNALPGSAIRVNPTTGQVIATVPVGRNGADMTTSPGAVWLASYQDGTVTRIDQGSNQVAATITLVKGLGGIAYGEGSIWVSNEQLGVVTRIDPATNQVVAVIPTVGGAEGVAVGGGAVWVANYGNQGQPNGLLSRIDPATNQVTRTIPVGTNPIFVAYGGGYVWVAMNGEPAVVQVNAGSNAIQARLTVVGPSWGIAASDHTAWVVQQNQDGLKAVPPQPGTVTRIDY